MRKISILVFLLSMLALPPVYAGCYRNVGSYSDWWWPPTVRFSVDYTKKNITSVDSPGQRIGTLTIGFTCPDAWGPGDKWYEDNFEDILTGASTPTGNIIVPLPEFKVASSSVLEHKDGWVSLKPDNPALSSFEQANGNSWWHTNIKFSSFANVMGGSNNVKVGNAEHRYGIYLLKSPKNTMSTSNVISFLTSASGMQINYVTGGNKYRDVTITPALSGTNTATLNFQNTVTCSVSNNTGGGIDLGMVNTRGNFKTPLTTVVLKMSCGLSNGGPQNITSNFPSVIVPGSASITIDSPTAQSAVDPSGNQVLHFGKGWGLKFETLGTSKLDINTLGNISIPVFAYKVSPSASAADSWSGAVNFTINYN